MANGRTIESSQLWFLARGLCVETQVALEGGRDSGVVSVGIQIHLQMQCVTMLHAAAQLHEDIPVFNNASHCSHHGVAHVCRVLVAAINVRRCPLHNSPLMKP